MIFQAGNVHESASLFNLKEKYIYMKESRIRTHDLDDPVYWLRSFTDLKSVRSLKKKKMDITAAIPPDTSIL